MPSETRAQKASAATRPGPQRSKKRRNTPAPRRFRRWTGPAGKCLRCFDTIARGDLAVELPERGGWMHDDC